MADVEQHVIDKLLKDAIGHHSKGEFPQAESLYLKILSQQPDNFEVLYRMASLCNVVNNSDMAIRYASEAMKINAESSIPIGILGLAFLKKQELDKAITCFKKAISIEPDNAGYYNNLASALHRQKEYKEASKFSEIAISLSPDNGLILNTAATIYADMGELEKALSAYKKSLHSKYFTINAVYNTVFCLLFLRKYDELLAFLSKIQEESSLSEFQMIGLNVTKAIIYFKDNNFDLCKSVLNKINEIPVAPTHIPFPNYTHFQTYYNYLLELIKFHYTNPKLYEGVYDKTLYLLGDSHCLSPAFTNVKIGKINYKCKPELIKGAQARHLSNAQKNRHTTAFDYVLKEIPKNSTVVIMFGEIDTRVEDGILPYHKKIGKLDEESINTTIKNIVTNYVEFCLHQAENKSLNLIFYGVPADSMVSISLEDKKWRSYIIKKFNEELSKITKIKGVSFIDIYSMTLNEDNKASSKYYIDSIHLKPTSFSKACNDWMSLDSFCKSVQLVE